MALDGRLCLSLAPKGYTENKLHWNTHQDTKELLEVISSVETTARKNFEQNQSKYESNINKYDDEEDTTSENDDYDYFKTHMDVTDEPGKSAGMSSDNKTTSDDDNQQSNSNTNQYALLSNNND